MERFVPFIDQNWDRLPMGLLHCPICIGLAVLSAIRFSAHAVMAYQLERGRAAASAHPATLLGTVFGI